MEPLQLPVGCPIASKLGKRHSRKLSSKSKYTSSNEEDSEEEIDGRPTIIQIPIGRPKPSDEVKEARITRDLPDVTPRISTGLNHITLIPVGNAPMKQKSESYRRIRGNSRSLTSAALSDNYSVGTQTRNHEDSCKILTSSRKKSRKLKENCQIFKEPLKDEQPPDKQRHGRISPRKKQDNKQEFLNYHSDNDSLLDYSGSADLDRKRSRMADIYKHFFRKDSPIDELDSKIKGFEKLYGSNFSSTDLKLSSKSPTPCYQRSSSPYDAKRLSRSTWLDENWNRSTAIGDQWPSYRELLNISTPKVNKCYGLNRTHDDNGRPICDQSVPNIEGQHGNKVQPSFHFWMTNLPDGSSLATIQTKSATNTPLQFNDISNSVNNSTCNHNFHASKFNDFHLREPAINHQSPSYPTSNFNSNFSNVLQSPNRPSTHLNQHHESLINPQGTGYRMANFHTQLQSNDYYQNTCPQNYVQDQRDYETKPFMHLNDWNQQCINATPRMCQHVLNHQHTDRVDQHQLCNLSGGIHDQAPTNSNIQTNQNIQPLHSKASNADHSNDGHFQDTPPRVNPTTYILTETQTTNDRENYLPLVNLPCNSSMPKHFILTPAHLITTNHEGVVKKTEPHETQGLVHRDVLYKDVNSTAGETTSGLPVIVETRDLLRSDDKMRTFGTTQTLVASRAVVTTINK